MSWWTTHNRLHPKVKNKFVVVFGATFYIPSVKSVSKPKVSFETKEFRLINHKFNYPGNATWDPVTIKFVDMNGDVNPKQRHEMFDTAAFLWQVMNNTGYRYPFINTSNYRDPVFNSGRGGTTGHWIGTKIDTEGAPNDYKYMTTPEKSSTIANSFGAGLSGGRDMKAASSAKQRISIYQIDPDGYTVELWHLVNPIVKSISWGDLDYSSDDLVEYELQVAYDWAILDRDAMGKEPAYSGTEYRDFMKTIYVTNQLDINDALEKRIQQLRQNDQELDNRLENLTTALENQQELLEAAAFGSQEYEAILESMDVLSGMADEFADERAELLNEQESILQEAEELYGESFADSLAEEFTNELNLLDDTDAAEDLFLETSDVYEAAEEAFEEYEQSAREAEALEFSADVIADARERDEMIPASIVDGNEGEGTIEKKFEIKGRTIIDSTPAMIRNDEGTLVNKAEYVEDLQKEYDRLENQSESMIGGLGKEERFERMQEIDDELERLDSKPDEPEEIDGVDYDPPDNPDTTIV